MSYLWPLIHTDPLGFLPPKDSDSKLGPILRESPPYGFLCAKDRIGPWQSLR